MDETTCPDCGAIPGKTVNIAKNTGRPCALCMIAYRDAVNADKIRRAFATSDKSQLTVEEIAEIEDINRGDVSSALHGMVQDGEAELVSDHYRSSQKVYRLIVR